MPARRQSLSEVTRSTREKLERQIGSLAARLQNADAKDQKELQEKRATLNRIDRFQPMLNGDRQCFKCWTRDEVRSPMKPIDSPDDEDHYECSRCHDRVSDPA